MNLRVSTPQLQTILLFLVYAAIITSVLAYDDLHHIAAQPHPYNSHATMTSVPTSSAVCRHRGITIDDDRTSAFLIPGSYFEGTNILVKINGTEPGGVLFSAHYDSVSTAPGATDDGMGVATLIQLVQYLARNRPKRTAVFNINNGEEDGLNGARAFMKHPWSNLTQTFINLEGAASGGRPILFRSSAAGPLRAFRVPHPHANVLSGDAFARGLIRSSTDYSVYNAGGLDGLDVAFYKGRSMYHTPYDAIPHTQGQERALWAMMEATHAAGLQLLNGDQASSETAPPVYFDLFGAALVVFSLDALAVFNILTLLFGPIALIFLNVRVLSFNFWLALFAAITSQVLLVLGYLKLNPFIVYSSPYLVLLSAASLALLALVLVLHTGGIPPRPTLLLHTYVLTWLLTLLVTVLAVRAQVGGLYFISAWHVSVLLACLACHLEGAHLFHRVRRLRVRFTGVPPDPDDDESRASERTPLLQRSPSYTDLPDGEDKMVWWSVQMLLAVPVPVILVMHVTVILLGALPQTLADGSPAVIVYAALSLLAVLLTLPLAPFTPRTAHTSLAPALAVLFLLSTAYAWSTFPFSRAAPLKVFFQQKLTLAPTGVPLTAYTTLSGAPWYIQNGILPKLPSAGYGHASGINRTESDRGALFAWPSGAGLLPGPYADTNTTAAAAKGAKRWLHANITRTGPRSARVELGGTDTRNCRIYARGFTDAISGFRVHPASPSSPPSSLSTSASPTTLAPPPMNTTAPPMWELRLWSRTWGRRFEVDIFWAVGNSWHGRLACEWAEHADAEGRGRMRAFEEVARFLPEWAVVSKATDGLVEIGVDLEV
ncbi:hypothetical protein BD779DRAFT_1666782 [Infundibulicybe gibba]|nr:hypothetical protein BD779DRAFT_1666782 [Infundibulicybe gibba]